MKVLTVAALLLGSLLLTLLLLGGRRWLDQRSSRRNLDIERRAARARVKSDIDRFGWHIVAINGSGRDTGFLFTIGLWQTYQHPELIVFSTRSDATYFAGNLRAVVERIEKGETFEAGSRLEGVFNHLPGVLRQVHRVWYPEFVGTAGGYYNSWDFPLLQLVWPDDEARFPWEGGFDLKFFRAQPVLSESNLLLARLPHGVLDLIENEQGLEPFRSALDELLVQVDAAKMEAALEDWHWLIGSDTKHLATTVFGDVFYTEPSGAVSILLTSSSEHFEVSGDRESWVRRCARAPEALFHIPLLLQLRGLDYGLEAGDVYSFGQALFLGGKETADNVSRHRAPAHVGQTGNTAEALKDTPPGTRVVLKHDFSWLSPAEPTAASSEGEPSVFAVVINDEEQYSMWPDGRELPKGWKAVGVTGTQQECLNHIENVWTDMRPKSLREKLDDAKPP